MTTSENSSLARVQNSKGFLNKITELLNHIEPAPKERLRHFIDEAPESLRKDFAQALTDFILECDFAPALIRSGILSEPHFSKELFHRLGLHFLPPNTQATIFDSL